ncbi:MAG: hypothetical protein ACHQC8_03520 [Solirubrobacterales bacterium]
MSDSQQSKRAQEVKQDAPDESTHARKPRLPKPPRLPHVPVVLKPGPAIKRYKTVKDAVIGSFRGKDKNAA